VSAYVCAKRYKGKKKEYNNKKELKEERK